MDGTTGGARTVLRCYAADGSQLAASNAPAASNGLSFVGISFNAGEQVARVVLESGNVALSASTNDGGSNDVVVMDDFIYGEPQPIEYSETPSEGSSFPVTIMIPLKFLEITTTGVPSGFVNATLRCAPHHTYRVFSSTDMQSWHQAAVLGSPVGPDQNVFNPRNPSTWMADTHAASLPISMEGESKLFYQVRDEITGDVACGETP